MKSFRVSLFLAGMLILPASTLSAQATKISCKDGSKPKVGHFACWGHGGLVREAVNSAPRTDRSKTEAKSDKSRAKGDKSKAEKAERAAKKDKAPSKVKKAKAKKAHSTPAKNGKKAKKKHPKTTSAKTGTT